MRKFHPPSPYLIALAGIAGAGVTAGAKYFIQSRARRAHRSAISLPPSIAENIRPWVVFNPSKHEDPQAFRNSVTMDARALGVRDIHFLETTIEDPGVSQARKAVRAGATHVIAAGGDGTVRAVAAGLAHTGVRMGILPEGTGNVLARNLGLPLDSPLDALAVALGESTRSVDLAWLRMIDPEERFSLPCEGKLLSALTSDSRRSTDEAALALDDEFPFVTLAGMGFDGETMSKTDPELKKTIGWAAYVISAVNSLNVPRMGARLKGKGADGSDVSTRFTARCVLFANCGDLPVVTLAPEASLHDGLVDVIAVDTQVGIVGWAHLSLKVFGQSLGLPAVNMPASPAELSFRQLTEGELSLDQAAIVEVDGDAIGRSRKVGVRIDQGALLIAG